MWLDSTLASKSVPEFLEREYGSFEVAQAVQFASDNATKSVLETVQTTQARVEGDDDFYNNGHNMNVFKKFVKEFRYGPDNNSFAGKSFKQKFDEYKRKNNGRCPFT